MVVLIDFAVALFPVTELARRYPDPLDERGDIDPCKPRPVAYKIHYLIPRIRRYPERFQISPKLFIGNNPLLYELSIGRIGLVCQGKRGTRCVVLRLGYGRSGFHGC